MKLVQTVNNAPQGGHCEFNGKGFSSGIQVMANAFSNDIQPGGSPCTRAPSDPIKGLLHYGQVSGTGNVLTEVVSSEKLSFLGAT